MIISISVRMVSVSIGRPDRIARGSTTLLVLGLISKRVSAVYSLGNWKTTSAVSPISKKIVLKRIPRRRLKVRKIASRLISSSPSGKEKTRSWVM